ncbi:MAG: DUF4923 family protein [Bacteroidaceae bacterium]|nr:DUF4923 family protein [Bacteroidaceae bacterium]
MKKNILSILFLAGTTLLAGCGASTQSLLGSATGTPATGTTTPTASKNSTVGSALESFLGAILGGSSLKQADIVGTWTYSSADCVFETENLLMKAGGEMAASKIEEKVNSTLSKFGMNSSKCSFTFNSDNTYSATIAGLPIQGTYTLDTEKKKITMTYLNGLGTMSPQIVKSGNKLSLLYDADKLLKLMSSLSALSGNSTLNTLNSLLSSYDGMLIGMQLQK